MSSALVRQALELVDPDENSRGRSKKAKRPALGQERGHPYKTKYKKKQAETPEKNSDKRTEETIRKLLALSKPTADQTITKKIIQRATGRKPLADKPPKKEKSKSILFPEDEDTGTSILLPDEDESILFQGGQDD